MSVKLSPEELATIFDRTDASNANDIPSLRAHIEALEAERPPCPVTPEELRSYAIDIEAGHSRLFISDKLDKLADWLEKHNA